MRALASRREASRLETFRSDCSRALRRRSISRALSSSVTSWLWRRASDSPRAVSEAARRALGDLTLGLVEIGAQGDQFSVLGAAGFELLADGPADLGDQRLDGLEVLHDPADAVEAAMDGLVALTDGLGGLDLVKHRFATGVVAQNGRLGVLIPRVLRQQSHLAHLRPMRAQRVPQERRRTPRISYPEVNNLVHGQDECRVGVTATGRRG